MLAAMPSLRSLAPLAVIAVACGGSPPRALAPGPRELTVSDGARLALHVAGHGPVCLFVHGGPGQDSRSFEQMGGNALEAFATMIYLDQRGSGTSPEAKDYRLARVVDDFEEVRAQLGVDKLCLIAHSFGGVLALSYALRYPARVSSLILANATLQFLGPSQQRMQLRFINEVLASLGKPTIAIPEAPADLAAASEQAFQAIMHTDQPYRLLTDHLATVQLMNKIESYPRSRGLGDAVMAHPGEGEYFADYAPRSAEVTAPVLVIASRADHAVGPDEHKRFRFPHATVVELDGGHMSYYDANAPFTAAIRAFLASQ